MKKRKIKDFIALYTSEEEEKLVLIQSGTCVDKTFMDNFWAAHTHALAMADVQNGDVISDRCSLNWPLTDKEREDGEYSQRFVKGTIYRIKVRGWKGTVFGEPQWYVTEVMEEGVSCPALEKVWAEYIKPIIIEDELLGTLTLDREMSQFNGKVDWQGKEIEIYLDVNIENKTSWTRSINAMKKLVGEQGNWDEVLRKFASAKLTKLANEWLADNDKTDRNPEKEPITEDEFGKRMSLMEIYIYSGGNFSACYDDDDMFWGHVIMVDGSLKKGPKRADIEG